MRVAFKVRAYPTPEQASLLNRTFGCIRLVWNRTLAWRHQRWYGEKLSTNVPQANAYLTALKREPELAFLNEVSSVPLQQVLRTQQKAFSNFFAKRARYPRFKSRTARQAAEYTRSAFRWRNGQLWLAKMTEPIVIVWSWPEVDPASIDPSTVTVSRDPDGRWYVSLAVDVADPVPLPATGAAVGVDLGVTDFAITSDGQRIANPRHLKRKARNLARYQRRMARKQRGSSNRAKAKAKVGRAHRKVRVRNRRLARVISDCGWGEFRSQLEYKAQRAGRTLVVIDRWYPSSKTCSACGHLLAEVKLSTRAWTCPGCRTLHDRDVNAAKNILAAGLAVTACGGDVRHRGSPPVRSPVKQEPQPARVGIPVLQGRE